MGWGPKRSQPCQVSSKLVKGFWLPEGSKSAFFLYLTIWLIQQARATAQPVIANLLMFADDTNHFFSGNDIDPPVKSVNRELEKITDWFKANKLSLNIKKTPFISFRTENKKIVSNISKKIDKIAINQETSTKFLGVITNQSLSWNGHIPIVKQKVSISIGIIKHIRKNLPQSVLSTLYFHLFILILNIVTSCGVYAAVLYLIVYSCCKKKQFVLLPTLNGILILLLCFISYTFCLCTS